MTEKKTLEELEKRISELENEVQKQALQNKDEKYLYWGWCCT